MCIAIASFERMQLVHERWQKCSAEEESWRRLCCGLGVRFSASAMATAWLCRPGAADMIATNDSNVPSWSQESPSIPAKVATV